MATPKTASFVRSIVNDQPMNFPKIILLVWSDFNDVPLKPYMHFFICLFKKKKITLLLLQDEAKNNNYVF